MGDRANIVLIDSYKGVEAGRVHLYTHWSGYKIEQIAADGIREAIAGGRADDTQYGGRIITDVFLKAHEGSPHTGCGVSGGIGDGDDHLVLVDFDKQQVTYQKPGVGATTVSFEQFVAAFPAVTADA